MININGTNWKVEFVESDSHFLERSDSSFSIGVCDNNEKTIYLNKNLHGLLLKKVLCHELVHAEMFSYDIELEIEDEEILADIIATYGEEIIDITDDLFDKMKRR